LVQFISVIGAFYFLKGLHLNLFPELKVDYRFYIYPLAVIGMIWFINLFNFMDGADGFASFETIIISLALFFFSGDVVNIILIACVSGFLYWNWPKAKIFMGDIGSTQLGFILIVLGIHFHNFNKFSILNWIMLSSPFWFDATYTLFRRWRNKEELSEAHRNHAYQRAIRGGFSHLKVNLCLLLIDLSVFIMILIYRKIELLRLPILIFTLISLFAITKIIDKKVPFR
jgi:Fuc2NAc and GlcNAc transferase